MVNRTVEWYTETKNKIFLVMNTLGINRMPSMSEVNAVTNDEKLSNRITKTGGFKHWAKELGLVIKDSESCFGGEYEELARSELSKRFKKVEMTDLRFPYDILINDRTKIDVKASRKYYRFKSFSYNFNLEYEKPRCDFYIAYCVGDIENVEKVLIIPAFVMTGKKQLSIGMESAYDKYANRWDLIEKYEKTMEGLVSF